MWGQADAGEEVTVQFGSKNAKVTADAAGKWQVTLAATAANATPQTLTITGKNTRQFADVLGGDVWVCSGQSNIEFNLGALIMRIPRRPRRKIPSCACLKWRCALPSNQKLT